MKPAGGMVQDIVAAGCLIWYIFILIVSSIGVYQIRRYYLSPPPPSTSGNQLPLQCLPYITIIRPVKGIEPYLYECLAATFYQTYASERLTIYFCISSRNDPAYRILGSLLQDFPGFDAKILVEEEDPNLSGRNGNATNLGPNPKIRNMSRAYREAKGDIVWIIDCNVWVGPDVCGQMVDLLCGFPNPGARKQKKYKFVHQLPLVIDVSDSFQRTFRPATSHTHNPTHPGSIQTNSAGGLLEELFLSTSHAKFYTAINTVAIAPCIVGKSNMFRRSHLNALTPSNPGIDHFSSNICEDHLIGDMLWYSPLPPSVSTTALAEGQDPHPPSPQSPPPSASARSQPQWHNHALLPPTPHNLAIQPTAHYTLATYLSRRIRWLRVRKFTVPLATLIEPGTESLLCSLYGAYGLTTLPFCTTALGIPSSWAAFLFFWALSVVLWASVDRWVWAMLTSAPVPAFGSQGGKGEGGRGLGRWIWAWVAREGLALPVWVVAVGGGTGVVWRGRRFRVGVDMRVREIGGGEGKVE